MQYFAYGSNMDLERMRKRCPSAMMLPYKAHVSGYVLAFNKKGSDGTAKANIVYTGRRTDRVYGVIYHVSQKEVEALDRAEGAPVHYKRQEKRIYVRYSNGKLSSRRCAVYVSDMVYNTKTYPSPESKYYSLVLNGAVKAELPVSYIESIKKFAPKVKSSGVSLVEKLGAQRFVFVLNTLRNRINLLSNKDFEKLITFYSGYYKDSIPCRIKKWNYAKPVARFRKFATNYIMGIDPIVGENGLIDFLTEFFAGIDSTKR